VRRALNALPRRAAAQLLRLIPGSAALRLKRDLRDAAWLKEADAVVISFPKSPLWAPLLLSLVLLAGGYA